MDAEAQRPVGAPGVSNETVGIQRIVGAIAEHDVGGAWALQGDETTGEAARRDTFDFSARRREDRPAPRGFGHRRDGAADGLLGRLAQIERAGLARHQDGIDVGFAGTAAAQADRGEHVNDIGAAVSRHVPMVRGDHELHASRAAFGLPPVEHAAELGIDEGDRPQRVRRRATAIVRGEIGLAERQDGDVRLKPGPYHFEEGAGHPVLGRQVGCALGHRCGQRTELRFEGGQPFRRGRDVRMMSR